MEKIDLQKIYGLNMLALKKINEAVAGVDEAAAGVVPEGETWNLQMIAEHIAIVESGILRVIGRLIRDADDAANIAFSSNFLAAGERNDEKLVAPEQARPTGNISLKQSLEQLAENDKTLGELAAQIEQNGVGQKTFPHPYFGDFNALDWFALVGHHRTRHRRQMKRIAAAITS